MLFNNYLILSFGQWEERMRTSVNVLTLSTENFWKKKPIWINWYCWWRLLGFHLHVVYRFLRTFNLCDTYVTFTRNIFWKLLKYVSCCFRLFDIHSGDIFYINTLGILSCSSIAEESSRIISSSSKILNVSI